MDKFNYDKDLCFSRFFKNSDPKTYSLLFDIFPEWWSRFYEYKWASEFAEKNDICLDAACGTVHHLKFFLASVCKEVHACDLDSEIENKYLILNQLLKSYDSEVVKKIEPYIELIKFKQCDISSLPYDNEKFDKIYCISVLEHLTNEILIQSLREFNRVLKNNGMIILTFDFPLVNFDYLKNAIKESNLSFISEVDFFPPDDLLFSQIYPGLCCCRAVLTKT